MRGALIFLVAFSLLTLSWADTAKPKTELRNHKQSERAYKAALEFVRAGDTEKATELLDQAVKLDPRNVSALTARELLRQNQVQQDVAKANLYLETSQSDRAIAELRRALAIDAENPAVQAALTSALSQEGAGSGVAKIRYRDA
ncbi:MAG: tetratricopeptide repeat protein, partial [Acidobacteria bacterium]|nr:tetratricopeptide repeat protein [Acidobacteriota bacterium]